MARTERSGAAAARELERGVLAKDRLFELAQRQARLDPRAARPAPVWRSGRRRARRPAGRSGTARASAGRAAALAGGALRRAPPARRPDRRGGRVRDRRRSASQSREAELLQAPDRRLRERLVGEVGERGPRHRASASRSFAAASAGSAASASPTRRSNRCRSSCSRSRRRTYPGARVTTSWPAGRALFEAARCGPVALRALTPATRSPHNSSISRSVETISLTLSSSSARSARCFVPASGSTESPSATSSGPRIRNCISLPSR